MHDLDRLKGFYDGIKELENLLKEAVTAGDDAKAAELRRAIQGSLRGIERWLESPPVPTWRETKFFSKSV